MFTDSYMRFSWKDRGDVLDDHVHRCFHFFQEILQLDSTSTFFQIDSRRKKHEFRPTLKTIRALFQKGVMVSDKPQSKGSCEGYDVTFSVLIDLVELGFRVRCGFASPYLKEVISCFPGIPLGDHYLYPIPETKFLYLVGAIVRCWSPQAGLFTFYELSESLGFDNMTPRPTGLMTFASPRCEFASKVPNEVKMITLDEGHIFYIPETALKKPKAQVKRIVQKLVAFIDRIFAETKPIARTAKSGRGKGQKR